MTANSARAQLLAQRSRTVGQVRIAAAKRDLQPRDVCLHLDQMRDPEQLGVVEPVEGLRGEHHRDVLRGERIDGLPHRHPQPPGRQRRVRRTARSAPLGRHRALRPRASACARHRRPARDRGPASSARRTPVRRCSQGPGGRFLPAPAAPTAHETAAHAPPGARRPPSRRPRDPRPSPPQPAACRCQHHLRRRCAQLSRLMYITTPAQNIRPMLQMGDNTSRSAGRHRPGPAGGRHPIECPFSTFPPRTSAESR